jgi:release factor glutamine methyltransferase
VPEARVAAAAGTARDALAAATDALAAAGVEAPRLDAELLLAEATGLDRAALAADPDRGVDPAAARTFGAMVRRRVAREPVAYILGRKGFRHLELRCDRRALVPRPETELLVEVALERRPESVLDVGTGSGAIALAVADELPGTEVVAVDTSADALTLARENADLLGFGDRVRFELGALPRPRHFDLVLANLHYVPESERRSLEPEITRHEPGEALFSGTDGLDAIRGLLAALGAGGVEGLRSSGVALEVGAGQAGAVARLVAAAGYPQVEIRDDLAGIGRVVTGSR